MKKIALTLAALSLTGCASMTDMMDSAAGMGKLSVDSNSFDNSTVISLTPDTLYNPDGGFSSIDTRIGAAWSSDTPSVVSIVLNDKSNSGGGGYTSFSRISIKIGDEIKEYDTGRTNLSNDGYNRVLRTIFTSSTASVTLPIEDFKAILSAKSCQLKISRAEGYEVASCSKDRIPGGKKTAILGFRKMLFEIEKITN
jgi:hypothetical protein